LRQIVRIESLIVVKALYPIARCCLKIQETLMARSSVG
jgi:hypothetical protein